MRDQWLTTRLRIQYVNRNNFNSNILFFAATCAITFTLKITEVTLSAFFAEYYPMQINFRGIFRSNRSNCESAIHSFLELNCNYIINLRGYEKAGCVMHASTAVSLSLSFFRSLVRLLSRAPAFIDVRDVFV